MEEFPALPFQKNRPKEEILRDQIAHALTNIYNVLRNYTDVNHNIFNFSDKNHIDLLALNNPLVLRFDTSETTIWRTLYLNNVPLPDPQKADPTTLNQKPISFRSVQNSNLADFVVEPIKLPSAQRYLYSHIYLYSDFVSKVFQKITHKDDSPLLCSFDCEPYQGGAKLTLSVYTKATAEYAHVRSKNENSLEQSDTI